MKSNAALKSPVIENTEVLSLIAMREAYEGLKRRLKLLEGSLEASETSIIDRLEQGAQVNSEYQLEIREAARRYPHWREQYALVAAQVPNAPRTEEVLAATPPTITKSLIVK